VLSWVLQKLVASEVQSSVILNPMLAPDEFLEMMMLDFGITDIPDSKARRIWQLHKFLLQGKRDGKISVLVVDEAHKLTPELLEEIRLLGNFECPDEKLLQVVLSGQSELDDLLNRPDLWQFRQRLSVRLSLQPLAEDEVGLYIAHRWSVAGGQDAPPFSPETVSRLAKWSKGIPRLINSICDTALVLAFADSATAVSAAHIDAAARDLRLIGEKTAPALQTPHTSARVAAQATSAPRVAAQATATSRMAAPPKQAAATPPAEAPPMVWPVRLRTVEAYGVKRSFWARFASKLGLA